ncbi:hypothetical protein RCL1_003981 [Eukaryota sp. TZLM3-RCL]
MANELSSPSPVLYGIGNPLLDLTAVVPAEYLEKYGLTRGSAILADTQHLPIYDEISKDFEVKCSGGGATLNSMRIASALLGPNNCAYTGAVGDDDLAKTLKECVEGDGVITHCQTVEGQKTGVCAVLVVDKERTLVTSLNAANHLSFSHIESLQDSILESKIIYSSGYVLTACPDVPRLAEIVSKTGSSVYAMNLGAPFLAEVPVFRESLVKLIHHSKFVFGNDVEALTFGRVNGWNEDLKEVCLKIANMPYSGEGQRIVVITCGAQPTLITVDGKTVEEFPVSKIAKEEIVDSNGAGDAFVGGFLAAYLRGRGIPKCVEVGNEVAGIIIRRSGVSIAGVLSSVEEM